MSLIAQAIESRIGINLNSHSSYEELDNIARKLHRNHNYLYEAKLSNGAKLDIIEACKSRIRVLRKGGYSFPCLLESRCRDIYCMYEHPEELKVKFDKQKVLKELKEIISFLWRTYLEDFRQQSLSLKKEE
jgi:hypothetical protein